MLGMQHNASWTVPRSIIGSFLCAGFINFGFLLACVRGRRRRGRDGVCRSQSTHPIASPRRSSAPADTVREPRRRRGAATAAAVRRFALTFPSCAQCFRCRAFRTLAMG